MTMLRALILALPILFLGACQSAPERMPVEEFDGGDELRALAPTDIAVVAVDARATSRDDATVIFREFPSDDLREAARHYLIERKSFAVPTSEWVDGTLARGGTADLETDAILEVTVDQWDTEFLAARGVIYAGAEFRLKSSDGKTTLWSYTCRDRQLPVKAPHGGSATHGNMSQAARRLAEDALSRLPRHER
ncbi:MAG: hypothetical protein KDB53_07240 [Planctomycetes bacterium]|nr:hypothetical protein [Planctomycetota bacterium]